MFIDYVGLVNKVGSNRCYFNSLVQTLFMTPEFRNALYNWKCEDKKLNTAFELQKLFVYLQVLIHTHLSTFTLTLL